MRLKGFRVLCLLLAIGLFGFTAGAAGYGQRRSLSYLYGGNTSIYENNVSRTRDCLNTLVPCYFGITGSGALLRESSMDATFLRDMKSKGVQVIPYVGNHWDQDKARAALANRKIFAQAIGDMVRGYDLDGIDIDIENINEKDRDNFTDLIRLIRANLPDGKVLSVCVPANPNGWTVGWHGAYDYAKLAQYCDYLFIMTYDESWQGGPAGPVASYSFIENSIKYALTKTNKDKIVIGLPFYGRYWVEGQTSGGAAFTVSDIENLTSRYNARVWYDNAHQCARATMTITAADVNTGIWGGKKLSAGVYDIWYENETSYEKKLALVRKYDVLGVGSWALGQEPEHIWEHYRRWLMGLPFTDIENHWAEENIVRLFEAGVISESKSNRYFPERNLTRAEAVAMLFRQMGLSESTELCYTFTDMRGHWSEGLIQRASDLGMVKGYPDGTFRPDATMTREEMSVMVARVLRAPDTIDFNQSFFPDVSPLSNTWSNQAIITLAVHGVLDGYPDGTFRPERLVRRSEAAKMFDGMTDLPKAIPGLTRFSQQQQVLPDYGGILEPR